MNLGQLRLDKTTKQTVNHLELVFYNNHDSLYIQQFISYRRSLFLILLNNYLTFITGLHIKPCCWNIVMFLSLNLKTRIWLTGNTKWLARVEGTQPGGLVWDASHPFSRSKHPRRARYRICTFYRQIKAAALDGILVSKD